MKSTKSRKETPPRSSNRLIYLDVLNILAILSVVFLHHNGAVYNFSHDSGWATSLLIETAFYFAVPLFLMISGATLLKYREKYDTKTYFKKRVKKVLIPSLAWMLIMFFWGVFITRGLVTDWSPASVINIITTYQMNRTYYFLFLIIGLYLTIPLFAPLTEKKYRKILWYGVIVFFFLNTLIPDVLGLFGIYWNGDVGLHIGSYVVYLFLGYLLSTQDLEKKYRIMLYVGAVLAVVYRYATTYFLSMQADTLVTTTWGYTKFHAILLASAVFVFAKTILAKVSLEKYQKALSTIAGCSFGIYLLHVLVLFYEERFLNTTVGIASTSWVYRIIFPFVTYGICLGIVLILKKIPLIKKIVP